ncbi:MAG: helix-turn-helix transcriptional regulator [Phycisphaerae bacterium]|nr:helix-turn-helix transcriptional regulator [Phycisphaerae bacterium]
MGAKIVELDGKRWAIMPEKEYKRLTAHAGEQDDGPTLPSPDERGEYPAVEYARVSLARKVTRARRRAGLSQAELARRAGIRPETLNRIEKGRTTPETATITKIQRVLDATPVDAED